MREIRTSGSEEGFAGVTQQIYSNRRLCGQAQQCFPNNIAHWFCSGPLNAASDFKKESEFRPTLKNGSAHCNLLINCKYLTAKKF